MRLWKVLGPERQSLVSPAEYRYPAGRWTRHLDPDSLALCKWGYHHAEGAQVLNWLDEGLLCEVEACPEHEPLRGDGKSVSCRLRIVRTFRLDARVLRLFACDCTERTLRRERKQGREPAPASWEAVRVSRLFANGLATRGELAAARDAWDAAGDAWAARAAADAGDAGDAGDAARDAEGRWQYRRLLKLVGA